MAQITKLVDDLDGVTNAEMTLVFGLDGTEYEIDLADKNYEEYRAALELLASKGRVVVRQPVKAKRTLSTGKKTGVTGKTQHIREWARENGFPDLSDRGRIPGPVMDAYETRSRMPIAAPETAVEPPKDEPKGEDTPDVDAVEQKVIERVKTTPKPTTRGKRTAPKAEVSAIRQALAVVGGEK